jgi:hypothetical protein
MTVPDTNNQRNRFPMTVIAAVFVLPITIVGLAVVFFEGNWGAGIVGVLATLAAIHTCYGMLKQWWVSRVRRTER